MSLKIPCNPTQHITKEDQEIEFINNNNNKILSININNRQERTYTPDSLNDNDDDNEQINIIESTSPTTVSSLDEEEHQKEQKYTKENFKEMNTNDDCFNEFIDNEQFNDYNQYFEIDDHDANFFDNSEEDEYEYEEDEDEDDENLNYLSLFKYTLKKAKPILNKKYASTGFLYNRFTYLDTIVECEENQMEQSGHSDLINETNKRSSFSCFNLSTNRPLTTKIIVHKGTPQKKQNDVNDSNLPEDNVERLRNIRDMFENSAQENLTKEQQELVKVEKLQPSEKLKERLLNDNFNDDLINDGEFTIVSNVYSKQNQQEEQDLLSNEETIVSKEPETQVMIDSLDETEAPLLLINDHDNINNKQVENSSSSPSVSSLSSNNSETNSREISPLHDRFQEGGDGESKQEEKIIDIPHVELTSRKTIFENTESANSSQKQDEPKPKRCITPPPEGVNIGEIENKPAERPQNVVSSADKYEDKLPESGLARSRKEMFQQKAVVDENKSSTRVKSMTPPREEKRVYTQREKTPERNSNVLREADREQDALPSAGTAKQTAAMFLNEASRKKSIDRSGITVEGELTEKGIAKQRLAMFSQMKQNETPTKRDDDKQVDVEAVSGIAKERLSLFKNLEQQRTSPGKETTQRKLKEFTPPPQLDLHLQQQRQYVIIEKETSKNEQETHSLANQTEQEIHILQGLAKNRMKQYLETAQQNGNSNGNQEQEALPEKGSAKSLLAKWKSIENVQDDTQNARLPRGVSRERTPPSPSITSDILPQSGTAKSLLNKWQNIDKQQEPIEKKSRQITPPRAEELNLIEKGYAKQALARLEQSVTESTSKVINNSTKKINIPQSSEAKVFYENTPAESNITLQYNNDEEVIPSPGYAKQLKSKFQTLEKEASKVETSSSKLAYVPKRFTSTTPTPTKTTNQSNGHSTSTTNKATNGSSSSASTSISSSEKCHLCEKTVYIMEKIEADKKLYHKLCFKCTICNCTLKLGNFSSIKGQLYCTPHYIQLFSRNGNYDEGFGLENYKRKWLNGSTSGSTNVQRNNENSIA